jgi:hypothetical protein
MSEQVEGIDQVEEEILACAFTDEALEAEGGGRNLTIPYAPTSSAESTGACVCW